MKLKYSFCLIAILASCGLIGQATLNVEGFARFEKTLAIGNNNFNNIELEINDTDNNNAALIDFSTATRGFITGMNVSSGNFYGTTTDDKISFITDDVVRMILTPEGFLGIGTPGPSERLHVREDGINTNKTTVMVLESETSKIPTLKFDEGGNLGMSIQYDGTGSGDNNKMHILNTIGTPAATFTNGGRLGIRETNPEEALEVDGAIVIDGSSGGHELNFYDGSNLEAKLDYSGQDLSLENDGFAGKVIVVGQFDAEVEGSGDILLDGDEGVLFYTNISTKGVLSGDGQFGINTTTPDAMFHVRAFANTGVALSLENDNNGTVWSYRAKDDLLELLYNGALKGTYSGITGQYTVFSDRRLKENITAMEDGVLAGINKLNPTEYYFKSDKERLKKSIGFIAQEMDEVFPIVVSKPETEDGFYGIQYSTISVLAIKALQEQQKEIDALKEDIEAKRALKEKLKSYRALAERLQEELVQLENGKVKE